MLGAWFGYAGSAYLSQEGHLFFAHIYMLLSSILGIVIFAVGKQSQSSGVRTISLDRQMLLSTWQYCVHIFSFRQQRLLQAVCACVTPELSLSVRTKISIEMSL